MISEILEYYKSGSPREHVNARVALYEYLRETPEDVLRLEIRNIISLAPSRSAAIKDLNRLRGSGPPDELGDYIKELVKNIRGGLI